MSDDNEMHEENVPSVASLELANQQSVGQNSFITKIWWIGRLLLSAVGWILSFVLIAAVKIYQWTISPLLGPVCRFHPSCSQYFILAVKKYGPIWGTFKGLYRITRCHPWNPGGYDPP